MKITEARLRQIIREEIFSDIESELEELPNPSPSEGLWSNIRKRRLSGKSPKRPGEKGYPKTLNID